MTPKNRTLEGKTQTLGGDGGLKIVKNRRTSLTDDPLLSLEIPNFFKITLN